MILLFKKEKVNKIQFSLNGETDHLKGCHSFTILYSAVICWNFSRRHNDLKPGFVSESPGRLLLVLSDCLFKLPKGLRQQARHWHSTGFLGHPLPCPSAVRMISFMSVMTAIIQWKRVKEERAHLLIYFLHEKIQWKM